MTTQISTASSSATATTSAATLNETCDADDSEQRVIDAIIQTYKTEMQTEPSEQTKNLLSDAIVTQIKIRSGALDAAEGALIVIDAYYRRKPPSLLAEAIVCDVSRAKDDLKKRKRSDIAEPCEKRAEPVEPEPKKTKVEQSDRYIVVTQHSGKQMLIMAVHPSNKLFFEQLFDRIREMPANRYDIGKKFLPRKVVEQFKETIAPSLGYVGRVYHRLERHWSAQDWIDCKCSLFDLLQRTEGAGSSTASANQAMPHSVQREIAAGKRKRVEQLLHTYVRDFSAMMVWLHGAIDSIVAELEPRLMFTTFQHCYLDLVYLDGGDCAVQFYERFSRHFVSSSDLQEELRTLRSITAKHLMEICEPIAVMRGLGTFSKRSLRRCAFRISKDVYDFLMHSMQMERVPKSMRTVMRTYLNFEVCE